MSKYKKILIILINLILILFIISNTVLASGLVDAFSEKIDTTGAGASDVEDKAGQIVGWVKNGEGDGYVSFGTFDCSKYEDIRYDENAFDLEFNCDGDILCKFN